MSVQYLPIMVVSAHDQQINRLPFQRGWMIVYLGMDGDAWHAVRVHKGPHGVLSAQVVGVFSTRRNYFKPLSIRSVWSPWHRPNN